MIPSKTARTLMPFRPSKRLCHAANSGGIAASTLTVAVLLGTLIPGVALAQGGEDVFSPDLSHDAIAPRAQAVRTAESPQVDGRLDEAAWAEAPVFSTFTQTEPDEGAPATQRTEVRIVYDDQAIYIGAMLWDTGPISTILARRDASMSESDVFVVLLDSYHDHQTAYRFATNPSGMMHDQIVTSGRSDSSWDPVWEVATEVTEHGWSVEMRIPFSQLRFSPDPEQVWGIQFERRIRRNQEQAVFAFTPLLERGGIQRFGHLDGIRGIRTGQRVELLPYLSGRVEALRPSATSDIGFSNPYQGRADRFVGVGLDLKFRVNSNLTLDATVNPDFGQVEVDPAVINLTAFETRFQERRPFFVEGADIFRFGEGGPRGAVGGGPEVLYSRRIGRSPQGSIPAGSVFSDVPTSTMIAGAAKLTGRIGEGWAVGLLEAVTARENARFMNSAGVEGRTLVEPATNYLIGRIRRDIRGGDTRFGAIVTAVNRDMDDSALEERLHSAAYTVGFDLVHQWASQSWRFNASFSPSLVRGTPVAIERTQRASSRYFQRPDASHLDIDPDATSLSGYYAMGMVEKQAGMWTGRIGVGVASPGYEVNDLGFQTAADRILFDTHLQYNQTRPGRLLRSWSMWGGPNGIWNYAGDYLLDNTNFNGRVQFMNYWGGSWRVSYSLPTLNDRQTRGGPLMRDPAGWQGNANFDTDSRKSWTVRGGISTWTDRGGSWDRSTNISLNLKPRENWEVQIGPRYSRSFAAAQYVTTVSDARAEATFGRRYVFGELDQTTVSMETRLNVTFTPSLSLQVYAQPFLSSGRYERIKELGAPRTFDFIRYGEDAGEILRQSNGFYRVDPDGSGETTFQVRDPDFNLRSLRGNAVLRWEWRAGSTLYLVWQQRRSEQITAAAAGPGADRPGDFDLGREAREMFGLKPDNIFAIKVTYWMNP